MQEIDRPLQCPLGTHSSSCIQIGDGPHQKHFADQPGLQWIQLDTESISNKSVFGIQPLVSGRSQPNTSSEIPSYLFDLMAINLAHQHTTPSAKGASLVILAAAGEHAIILSK